MKVIEDSELSEQPDPCYVKGKRVEGGPQMLPLSLDGKRLYFTSSLYSVLGQQVLSQPPLVRQSAFSLIRKDKKIT